MEEEWDECMQKIHQQIIELAKNKGIRIPDDLTEVLEHD
jgi:hypothetical protein